MRDEAGKPPQVSVIIPAYRSQATLAQTLESLQEQTFGDFETLVVDSSPDDAATRTIMERFPEVRYYHVERRLLPHAARNYGVERARGELLVFTDPDVVTDHRWLEHLLAAAGKSQGVVVGSAICFGRRWVDLGAHLAKFDKWLPRPGPVEVDMGPTMNLLVRREVFEAMGPFPGGTMHGDTLYGWRLRKAGIALPLAGDAVVAHHHTHTWRGLIAERFSRGQAFGALRIDEESLVGMKLLQTLLISLLPLRLASQLLRVWRNARQAEMAADFWRVLPIVVSALAAWLAGESLTYSSRLLGRRSP